MASIGAENASGVKFGLIGKVGIQGLPVEVNIYRWTCFKISFGNKQVFGILLVTLNEEIQFLLLSKQSVLHNRMN